MRLLTVASLLLAASSLAATSSSAAALNAKALPNNGVAPAPPALYIAPTRQIRTSKPSSNDVNNNNNNNNNNNKAALEAPPVKLADAAPSLKDIGDGSYDPGVAQNALFYSKTAYCDADAITSWSCATCGFNPTMQSVQTFMFDDTQAYTGYSAADNQIIVAFRGSSNIPNWISDLDFFKMNYPPCGGNCEVHKGFYSLWSGFSPSIIPAVQGLLSTYADSNPSIFVTGHSLGAAVSVLAAISITNTVQGVPLTIYNFGEPRVGDANFAAYAASVLPAGYQFRVTHHKDPVPHVPPEAFGFLHTPHEVFYPDDGATTYTVCDDSSTAEDSNCSDQYFIPDDVEDHLHYLGFTTECQNF